MVGELFDNDKGKGIHSRHKRKRGRELNNLKNSHGKTVKFFFPILYMRRLDIGVIIIHLIHSVYLYIQYFLIYEYTQNDYHPICAVLT